MASLYTALLLFCRIMLLREAYSTSSLFLSNKQNRLKFKLFNFLYKQCGNKNHYYRHNQDLFPLEFCSIWGIFYFFGGRGEDGGSLRKQTLKQHIDAFQITTSAVNRTACKTRGQEILLQAVQDSQREKPVMRCPGLSPCHWLKQALPTQEQPSLRHSPRSGIQPLRLQEMPIPCTDGNSGLTVKDVLWSRALN